MDRKVESAVVSHLDFARNFPGTPEVSIDRDNLLDTLPDIPSADTPVVFLEGHDGAGATTLLSQFALRNKNVCFALFIKPASRFAYSPDYLRLVLAEQMWFYIHGERLDAGFLELSQFELLLLHLKKQSKGRPIYFLVDGLHEIDGDDQRVSEILKTVLPIGLDSFRFIITGQQNQFQPHLGSVKSKTYQILKLSDSEARQFLVDLDMPIQSREELLKLCAGNPGRLASVRRLLKSGTAADQILVSEPSKYLEFLNLEFAPVSSLSDTQRRIIASLAYTRHPLSNSDILEIIPNSSPADFEAIESACVFIERSGDSLEFRSEAHRRLAESSLSTLRQDVLTLQVEALIRSPESKAAVRLLPTYYQSLNQQQAIIDLLSKDHYARLLADTQSIAALRARAALGARSAFELRQATEVFQFALQRSIFCAVAEMDELESEVGALVALGQQKRALDIAAQSSTKEKRLFLLAEFARRSKERGTPVDEQVVIYIQELANAIDCSELGDSALRLAENLLFVDPDLALSIADSAMKASMDENQKNDAYARLSMVATMGQAIDNRDAQEKSRAKITDEKLQELMSSLNLIVSDSSFDEIKKIALRMEIGRRIYFLRQLVTMHSQKRSVLDLVEFAIEQLVANVTYVPKARDLSDLAHPLASCVDELDRVKNLIKRIEGQIGLIEKGAPSADLVRLQMALAHAELGFDSDKSKGRITDTYFSVASMENVDNKILCLSQMSRALARIDSDGELELSDGFRAVILGDLKTEITELLSSTANHYQVSLPAVRALAAGDSRSAISIIEALNTESRRDSSYAELACQVVASAWSEDKSRDLHKAVNSIRSTGTKSACVRMVVDAVSKSTSRDGWIQDAQRLVANERNPNQLSEAAVCIGSIAAKTGDRNLLDFAIRHFDNGVDMLDSLPVKVDLLFRMSACVAEIDQPSGSAYFERAASARSSSAFSGGQSTSVIAFCAMLMSRAFRGMFKGDNLNHDHLERFFSVCETIPCALTRSDLYADLACRAWCEGRVDVSRDIINRFCRPLLSITLIDNEPLHAELCEAWFSALFCVHSQSALDALPKLSKEAQEHVLVRTCLMVLRKVSPIDPWEDSDSEKLKISHEGLLDVHTLLSKAPTDWSFYTILTHVAKIVSSKENRSRLSGQQRTDFVSKVRVLIAEKLPDANNITHDGYVISSNAQVLRIAGENRLDEWMALVRAADGILNLADRAFVLLEIADCMPQRLHAEKRTLFHRSYEDAKAIPSVADKYNRIENYIRIVKKSSPQDAKAALRQAMILTFDQAQPRTAAEYRRNLVDIAEAIDSDVLDQLAEMIDDDPARAQAKSEMRRSVEVSKLRRKLVESTERTDASVEDSSQLPSASWKNLKSLISGRLETKPPERMMRFLSAAGALTLHDAYPVLSWFIENCTRRFTSPTDVSKQIEPLCEVLLLSTEIAAAVIAQAPEKKGLIANELTVPDAHAARSLLVKPGERDEAVSFIREWLRSAPEGTLYYCDPYFSQTDIELLRLVLSEKPDSDIKILTTLRGSTLAGSALTPESLLAEWSAQMSQEPPDTEIIVVAGVDDVGLVHDRWLIAGETGLRLGTSFKSLGAQKLTEISEISASACAPIMVELENYYGKKRYVNGARITYSTIQL